jgi:hypothetical protein
VSCAGYPSRAQVLTLLTGSAGLIPQGTGTVKVGPLCAGTWQYTTVEVPNRDMLEVITKGAPNALVLVTAGTNVCNIPVRTSAPIGIRTVACESGPAPGNV